MPLINSFSITNRKGASVGLSFGTSADTQEKLTALLLKQTPEGCVVFVNGVLSFVFLDRKWFPVVSADRSYLERPKDFMGVLERGRLRRSDTWKESWISTSKELWKWKRHRGIGVLEQPTMKKCFEGKYKRYDPLSLGR